MCLNVTLRVREYERSLQELDAVRRRQVSVKLGATRGRVSAVAPKLSLWIFIYVIHYLQFICNRKQNGTLHS